MEKYREIKGNLITLAQVGEFDVIAHGANCFNTQGAGIALQMSRGFNTHRFDLEKPIYRGDMDKLGNIDYEIVQRNTGVMVEPLSVLQTLYPDKYVTVVNAYTQYQTGKNVDYAAIDLCLKKINYNFKGSHIGLPLIGCGIAGGDWEVVKAMILKQLKDVNTTIVHYER